MTINTFGTEEEVAKMMKWAEEHYDVCPIREHGAIGGRYTYEFTPTSIGTVCAIKCSCGAKFDATEYDWW